MQLTMSRTAAGGAEAEATANHLQEVLAELIDLTLQAKQAHWNVVGPHFRALHLQLDQLVEHTRRFADTTAERIVTLGRPAQGSAVDAQQQSKLDPLPTDFIRDDDAVTLLVERLDAFCRRQREYIRVARERDPVSENLLVSMLAVLEEQLWMFHAQAQ